MVKKNAQATCCIGGHAAIDSLNYLFLLGRHRIHDPGHCKHESIHVSQEEHCGYLAEAGHRSVDRLKYQEIFECSGKSNFSLQISLMDISKVCPFL